MTLVYRQEYVKTLGAEHSPRVLLPQEWLIDADLPDMPLQDSTRSSYRLLGHCTERTNAPGSMDQWLKLFTRFHLPLEHANVGCCGMSGTYGHERRNLQSSVKIFQSSWGRLIETTANPQQLLADGYSCRSQVGRLGDRHLPHPISALLAHIRGA